MINFSRDLINIVCYDTFILVYVYITVKCMNQLNCKEHPLTRFLHAPAHCGNIFPAVIFKLKSESGISCKLSFPCRLQRPSGHFVSNLK